MSRNKNTVDTMSTPRIVNRRSLDNRNNMTMNSNALRKSLDPKFFATPINNSPLRRPSIINSPQVRKSLGATNGFILSPNRRRSLEPPRNDVTLDENDDEAERRRLREGSEKRRPRESIGSPSNKSTPLATSLSGMSAEQMSEHLAKCIKLSTENKINAKNAFHLQLIDYMQLMVKKRDFDVSNFQMVGCTLDASTKIYSCRVDCVHTDVMKMAGAIGHEERKKKKGGGGEDEENDEGTPEGGDGDEQAPTRKKTIRKNRNIIIKDSDSDKLCAKEKLEPKRDPYFQRLVTLMSEDGDACHFIKNLKIGKDTCILQIFPDTPYEFLPCPKVQREKKPFQLPSISALDNFELCPTFSDFSFLDWSLEKELLERESQTSKLDEIEQPLEESPPQAEDTGFAFDMNAEPENDAHDYDFRLSDDERNDDTEQCRFVQANNNPAVVADVRKHLSTEPQEYSYFRSSIIDLWAGPAHWKIRPYSTSSKGSTSHDGKAIKNKRQKRDFLENYERNIDFELMTTKFATTDGIKLQRKTVHCWGKDKTTLPPDPHIELKEFFKLGLRPRITVTNTIQRSQSIDDHLNEYDYDNEIDRENFCPDIPNDDDCQADEYTQELPPPSQDIHTYDTQMTGAFTGENLVAPPNKVARIYIPYALQPKRIDMKKLKSQIWYLVTKVSSNKENIEEMLDETTKVREPKLFSEIYKDLPSRLSKNAASNLSAPLMFSALLHLTNEKSLCLEGVGKLEDIRITQD